MSEDQWFFVTAHFADVKVPCWLHDCPKLHQQVVISTVQADSTGCPACGERPVRRIHDSQFPISDSAPAGEQEGAA